MKMILFIHLFYLNISPKKKNQMDDFQEWLDDFHNNMIDLTIHAIKFPCEYDYKFRMLDPEFSDQMENLSIKTFSLLSKLSDYVNFDPSNSDESLDDKDPSIPFDEDDIDSIYESSEKAIQSLINSRDIDVLDKPPSKNTQQIQQTIQNASNNDIIMSQYGNYTFFFSKNVPKPPKFVTPTTTYSSIAPVDLIKPLKEIPLIVNSKTPQFDVSKVINVRDISKETQYVDEIIRSFPNGPLFVASLNHRVRTYRPFSSLLLIMTPQYKVYIFDILSLRLNLSPLRELLMNKDILKIMYDAGEDIKILAESLNMYVVPLFDISLIESPLPQRDEIHPLLIEDIVVPHLKKCFGDWRIRPLNDELLTIAAQSVWHLQSIANEVIIRNQDRFLEIINDSNNSWYSFGRMPNLPYIFGQDEAEEASFKIFKLDQQLSDQDKDIIFELVKWRDSIAVIEEESPNFIATDEAILKIAKDKPLTAEELVSDLNDLMTPQLSTYVTDILLIVKNNSENSNEEKDDVISLLNKI